MIQRRLLDCVSDEPNIKLSKWENNISNWRVGKEDVPQKHFAFDVAAAAAAAYRRFVSVTAKQFRNVDFAVRAGRRHSVLVEQPVVLFLRRSFPRFFFFSSFLLLFRRGCQGAAAAGAAQQQMVRRRRRRSEQRPHYVGRSVPVLFSHQGNQLRQIFPRRGLEVAKRFLRKTSFVRFLEGRRCNVLLLSLQSLEPRVDSLRIIRIAFRTKFLVLPRRRVQKHRPGIEHYPGLLNDSLTKIPM